jgi:endonuclease/exonuclease/phosphatase family metal-dependent hydrolase
MPILLVALLILFAPAPGWATDLKLATWNLAWLTLRPAGDPALPRDVTPREPEDFARLAGYAQRLDADIVAFQEVDGPAAAARVFDPAQYTLVFPDERDIQRSGFALRRGLFVTQNPDLDALDLFPGARFSLRRGTDLTVRAGDRTMRLLSVHLKGGCRDAGFAQPQVECETLAKQTRILANWVEARQREGIPFVILGDFNRAMAGPEDELQRALAAAAPITRVTERLGNPCWSTGRGATRFVDHIILGGEARDWLVPDSLRVMVYAERDRSLREKLSDHCPLSIRLAVP